jgi:hypothetical protein
MAQPTARILPCWDGNGNATPACSCFSSIQQWQAIVPLLSQLMSEHRVGCTHDLSCKSFPASGEAWRCRERLWPSSLDAHRARHCRALPDKWCVQLSRRKICEKPGIRLSFSPGKSLPILVERNFYRDRNHECPLGCVQRWGLLMP